MTEQGLPGATINGWFAFLAPAGTPRAVVDKLNEDFARILGSPQIHEILAREGSEPAISTPDELGKHIAQEIARLRSIVVASGARRASAP